MYVLCSLLNGDVEMNSEKLMKRKLASGDVVNGVVEQVDTAIASAVMGDSVDY